MEQEEYILESERTCAQLPPTEHQIHMMLGVTGEFFKEMYVAIGSEDNEKAADEIGDVLWYLAGLARSFGMSSFIAKDNESDVFIAIGSIAEALKKKFVYGKDYDLEEMQESVFKIYETLEEACESADLDIKLVMQKNIEKLRIRFPEKFEKDLAINKDDSAEKKVFQ